MINVSLAVQISSPMQNEPVFEPEGLQLTVKVRMTRSQFDALNHAAAEQRVTRSWLIREAVHLGLPPVLALLEQARAKGFSVGSARRASRASTVFRGPRDQRPGGAAFAPVSGTVAVVGQTLRDPEEK